jgi:hypothetical protein
VVAVQQLLYGPQIWPLVQLPEQSTGLPVHGSSNEPQ